MRLLSALTSSQLQDKTILVRCDLNMPFKDGIITDETRLQRLLPTLTYLQKCHVNIILMSHFARPKGQYNPALSFQHMLPALETKIGQPIEFLTKIQKPTSHFSLLENIRFHPEEEENDEAFAKKLASLGDIFINDAFSASHRAHASIAAIQKFIPSYAGLSLEGELRELSRLLKTPQKPNLALIGGAKISSKINLLKHIIPTMDHLILGGAMANTFLAAQGITIGKSLFEPDELQTANEIFKLAKKTNCNLHLPIDALTASKLEGGADYSTYSIHTIPADQMILDIGPETIALYKNILKPIKTLLWNGPLGVFEFSPFEQGTHAIARYAAQLCSAGSLIAVAGGGDTVAALNHAQVSEDFSYISTAGGAFLEWLEGRVLPGIAPLLDE